MRGVWQDFESETWASPHCEGCVCLARNLAFVLEKLLLGLNAGVTGADLPGLKSA